jgi:dimethylaniline monooxygenase (N-oxide forming)
MRVAIVGGGPSGLVTLKFLLKAHEYFSIPPIEAVLFEAEDRVGGTFVRRVYEDAEVSKTPKDCTVLSKILKLVSSKYLTAFSDSRFSPDMPDFVTPEQYVRYLNNYATQFKLWDSIRCGYRVQRIRRALQGRGHVITVTNPGGEGFQWNCDAIAICSGLNVHPNIPNIQGLNHVPVVLHSSQLKERKQFGIATDVVILGAGETAMDLGHLAITSPTRSVTICHKNGFFCAPKVHQAAHIFFTFR